MQHATQEVLNSLAVPESCSVEGFESPLAGQPLVDGELRGENNEMARLVSEFDPVFFDFNGDGAEEALVVFYCDGGGVPWPDQLLLVAPDGRVMDGVSVADTLGQTKGRVQKLTHTGSGAVEATFAGEQLPYDATVTVANDAISVAVADPFDGATLSLSGFGPVQLGANTADLVAQGLAVEDPVEECPAALPSEVVQQHRIHFVAGIDSPLWEMWTTDPNVLTPSGAHVGGCRKQPSRTPTAIG